MYFDFVDEAHREPTVYKLIVYGEDEKVVGLHMVGQGSDEGIQGFSVAIKMGGASESSLDLRFVFSSISSYKEEL